MERLSAIQTCSRRIQELEAGGEDGQGYQQEFQMVRDCSGEQRQQCPATVGLTEQNRKKNRYKDIIPFDDNRVKLDPIGDAETSTDYINASFIKGPEHAQTYIASQGPLEKTVTDFWAMLWQQGIKTVVMACRLVEMGKKKCEKYWPDKDETLRFGDITVTLVSEVEGTKGDFTVRELSVLRDFEQRTVKQFHFTAWPDRDIPRETRSLLDMIALARDHQPGDQQPIVVHCSAGCGRTGTICAIDYAWLLLEKQLLKPSFRLFDLVLEMRTQRPAMVQVQDQYVCAHRAVKQLFVDHAALLESPYEDTSALPAQDDVTTRGPSVLRIQRGLSGDGAMPAAAGDANDVTSAVNDVTAGASGATPPPRPVPPKRSSLEGRVRNGGDVTAQRPPAVYSDIPTAAPPAPPTHRPRPPITKAQSMDSPPLGHHGNRVAGTRASPRQLRTQSEDHEAAQVVAPPAPEQVEYTYAQVDERRWALQHLALDENESRRAATYELEVPVAPAEVAPAIPTKTKAAYEYADIPPSEPPVRPKERPAVPARGLPEARTPEARGLPEARAPEARGAQAAGAATHIPGAPGVFQVTLHTKIQAIHFPQRVSKPRGPRPAPWHKNPAQYNTIL